MSGRVTHARVPVVVFGVGGHALAHGALGMARSAGRRGIAAYAIHGGGPRSPVLRSRYWTGSFAHPGPRAGDDEWLTVLGDAGRRLGRALLVAIDDSATMLVARHAGALREWFLFPEQSPELIRSLSDKGELHRLCVAHDVPTPSCAFPRSAADVSRIAAEHPFPIVVKRRAGWHAPRDRSAPSVAIVPDRAALLRAYERMESDAAPNVLLQDHIPGGSESIWMFNGYFDRRAECRFGLTGRKLRQRGPDTGPTTLGECRANETVAASTRRLMKSVGYHGILDLGFRHDARDGSYRLLDVNPRIGETFRLFVAADGTDVLAAAYLDLTGAAVAAGEPVEGRRWVVEPFDAVASAQLWRAGRLGAREWARSLGGVQERAWLAADDPRPFAAMSARLVGELARRARRRAQP